MGQIEKSESEQLLKNNVILTTVESALNWGRGNSLWPVLFGLACCAIEMMAAGGARFDLGRFGYEVFRASPRQSDLLIVSGTVTDKMAPLVKRIYEQMPEPKYVLAMGNCAVGGGPFIDSYCVVPGIDTVIPVDVYVPGCPPRPEALMHGMLEIKKKINKKSA